MNSVLVFTGRSAVDSADFRWQLLRVPEISKVFKQAQQTLDVCESNSRDLVSFMQSETNEYLSGGLLRDLCAQLVQIGLYRRYVKNFSQPKFVVGDAGEISASAVCFGKVSLEELILIYSDENQKRLQEAQSTDFLVGQRLETSKLYGKENEEYVVVYEGKDTNGLLEEVMKDYLIDQVITLGSSQSLTMTEAMSETGVVESVVMDPLLSWILPFVKNRLVVNPNLAAGF